MGATGSSVDQAAARIRPAGAEDGTRSLPSASGDRRAGRHQRAFGGERQRRAFARAQFAASQKAASKGVPVVPVHGLGDAAWAVKAGNGLAVPTGNLDIVIAAPQTTVAELEALARKIL